MAKIPLPVNNTGLVELGTWASSATGGFFWIMILLVLNIVAFTFMSRFGFARAAFSSLFFIIVLALPLRFLGYIGDLVIFIYGILLAASFVLLFIADENA